MKDSPKKIKPTLQSLLIANEVIKGEELVRRIEDKERERAQFDEALEFELRNRKSKHHTKPTTT